MSGFPSETGNDRLADIEAWAHDILSIATISRARDVLALVEIAKAAHDTVDAYEADVAWEDLRVTELAAALARLDRSSSDGTADSGAAE